MQENGTCSHGLQNWDHEGCTISSQYLIPIRVPGMRLNPITHHKRSNSGSVVFTHKRLKSLSVILLWDKV